MVLSSPLVGRSECQLHPMDGKCQSQYRGVGWAGLGWARNTARLEKPRLTLCFPNRLPLEVPTCPASSTRMETPEG